MHVHLHDCFDRELFFNSILKNAVSYTHGHDQEENFAIAIFLAESKNSNNFEKFSKEARLSNTIGKCEIRQTDEECSLNIRAENGMNIYLISGRQIITSENIEVLALATSEKFDDGLPIKSLIDSITKAQAIPVIPWGFGKWTGKRGALVTQLIQSNDTMPFFLGDNGGRTAFLPYPAHFLLAKQKGFKILPGTDPLPFPSECKRVGSFGCIMQTELSKKFPAAHIKEFLFNSNSVIQTYGKLVTPYRFLLNQIRIQFKKSGQRSGKNNN